MFSERDIVNHSLKRRKVASLYSVTALLSYEGFVDKCNQQLCNKLEGFTGAGKVINIYNWMQYYAFDVIGEISVSGKHNPSWPLDTATN
jgi:hypothetical protein